MRVATVSPGTRRQTESTSTPGEANPTSEANDARPAAAAQEAREAEPAAAKEVLVTEAKAVKAVGAPLRGRRAGGGVRRCEADALAEECSVEGWWGRGATPGPPLPPLLLPLEHREGRPADALAMEGIVGGGRGRGEPTSTGKDSARLGKPPQDGGSLCSPGRGAWEQRRFSPGCGKVTEVLDLMLDRIRDDPFDGTWGRTGLDLDRMLDEDGG